ncbi:MAG TPA: alpha-amylase family glycosyl hydrolase [Labilithrix sp.]
MRLRAAAITAFLALGAACSSSKSGDADPAGRVCGLRVWYQAKAPGAHVEIVGDWNDWQRPGVTPDSTPDGWRVAQLDPSPGEHAYAIVEDGVWLSDPNVPLTAFHDGKEVALAIVPDCDAPALAVKGVDATPDGNATVHVSFLPARDGAAVDASSISAPGLAASAIDGGDITLSATGLNRGKYIYHVTARDSAGRAAPEAVATVWIEDEPWDPRDAIVYQVMLDRYRSDKGPLAPPSSPAERAGGNLAGLRQAVERGDIDALGVNTLWVSPLYANPDGDFPGADGHAYSSYHGYWPIASRDLDARVASEQELDAFMLAAHSRGIRVLFDVVPNHVHEQHPWVKEHPDWFIPSCTCGAPGCDWADHIETCWFAPYLPDLDWTNPEPARAMTAEVMWWMDRWGADGLRIDAVPMMPRAASRRIMYSVRQRYAHPGNEPYVLGENFTGPGAYDNLRYDLGPFGLDGSFDFPLMWVLRETIATEQAPMSEIDASMKAGNTAWDGSGAVMGLIIGNHDVARFASASAGTDSGDTWTAAPQPLDPTVYAKQRLALATVLTLPGAPVLYYGDEIGLAGKSDPDCRRVMPADSDLLDAQRQTRDLVSRVARARRCSKALRRGGLTTIGADLERYVFARTSDDGDVAIVALARRPTTTVDVTLPPGSPAQLVDVVTGTAADTSKGTLTLPDDAFGVHVWVAAGSPCAKP